MCSFCGAGDRADASIALAGKVDVVACQIFNGALINVVAIRAGHVDDDVARGELFARGNPNDLGRGDARADGHKVGQGGLGSPVVGAQGNEDFGCGEVRALKALAPCGAGDALLGEVRAFGRVGGGALRDGVANEKAWGGLRGGRAG